MDNLFQEIVNSRPWGIPMELFLPSSLACWGCASLSKRMWISANQLEEDPSKREKVFRAIQQIYTSAVVDKKDDYVRNFIRLNRVSAIAVGLFSIKFGMEAISIVMYQNQ
jgi:hypothetical protein